MGFFSKCGKKIDKDARFCSFCGTPVGAAKQNGLDESAHCPSCGHLISALEVTCPACGFEIKKRGVSSSIKELSDKLEAIDRKRDSLIRGVVRSFNGNSLSEKAEEKAQVIRSFPIPTTKNDVFELLYMAASNVNAKVLLNEYSTDTGISAKDYAAQKHIVSAWNDKLEQAYQKARAAFGSDPDFEKIQAIYDAKKAEMEMAKKEKRKSKRTVVLGIIAFALIPIIFFGQAFIRYRIKDRQLEATVVEIRQDIANGDYDSALIKANSLHMDVDWSSESELHWNKEREALIKLIEEKRAEEKK